MMNEKTPAVGDPIETRCTKCRKITNHIIVAMQGAQPAKVQCNTCQGQHLYRKAKAAAQTAAQKAANARLAEQKEWSELQLDKQAERAEDYSMDGEYTLRSLIRHPRFGIGLVRRIVGDRKIEVLFEEGLKTMRCR